jgi:hypothetical protein
MLIMKNIKAYYTILVLATIVGGITLNSCEKTVYEIGTETSKLEGIHGSWNISTVMQIDEASPLKDEMDLSQFFIIPGQAALSLTFDSQKLEYSTVSGGGKNPFGDKGSWEFDDVKYPSYLTMYSDEGDTIVMGLGQTIRPTDPNLYLNQQKTCEGTAVLTYQYIFDRK